MFDETVPTAPISPDTVLIAGKLFLTVLTFAMSPPTALTLSILPPTRLTLAMSVAVVLTLAMWVATVSTSLIFGATVSDAITILGAIAERRSRLWSTTSISLPIPFP